MQYLDGLKLIVIGGSILHLVLHRAHAEPLGPPRNPGICLAETALDKESMTGKRWERARDSQEMLAAIDPKSSSICRDWLLSELSRVQYDSSQVKDKNCFIMSNEEVQAGYAQQASVVTACQAKIDARGLIAFSPTLSARYQDAVAREATAAKEAANMAASKSAQAAVADVERNTAESQRLEAIKFLMASITVPMLCMINGKSKPTLYLDLGVNDGFRLVRDGIKPVTGRWGRGSIQGQSALIMETLASPENRFPDVYTVYEHSMKVTQSAINLTLARRSTFPGSRSADGYEAVCVKSKSLTLEQAQQLTGANLKDNPLRAEVLTQRQQAEANRPSAEYCTKLEDTYADRPALQKQLMAKTGCY